MNEFEIALSYAKDIGCASLEVSDFDLADEGMVALLCETSGVWMPTEMFLARAHEWHLRLVRRLS